MITRKNFLHLWVIVLGAVLLSIPVSLAHAETAQTATKLDGYTLTVTESFSSFEYGSSSPQILATLTVPAGSTDQVITSGYVQPYFYITIDSVEVRGEASRTSDPDVYTYTILGGRGSTIPPGVHTVQAVFNSVSQGTTITSDPLTLTVTKVTPTSLDCDLNSVVFYNANASITPEIALALDPNLVTDRETGTYSITFVGPQTYTEANLVQNDEGLVTFTFPPVAGTYQYQLTFNGTALSNPISTTGTVNVTAGNPVTLKLSSNPAKTTPGATVTYSVVVSGRAGLPTPTGMVNILLKGQTYDPQTDEASLDSTGRVQIQITLSSDIDTSSATPILVAYHGDYVYEDTQDGFSLTNPSGGSTGSPAPTPASTSAVQATATNTVRATVTPGATPTNRATATSTATVMATGTVNATNSTSTTDTASGSSPFAGNIGGWVLGTSLPIAACASIFGFGTWQKRKQRSGQNASATYGSNSEISEVHEADIDATAIEEEEPGTVYIDF